MRQSMREYDSQSRAFELTRRFLCMMGAGLSAAGLLEFNRAAALAAKSGDLSTISHVVTDQRFEQSRNFGKVLAGKGVQALEVTDGLTRLWREALVPLWQGAGGAVAGITDHGTWACIAEQARSHGRRSILVGRHAVVSGGGSASHLLAMGTSPAQVVALLDRCGDAWPHVMADFVSRYPTAARPVPNQRHQGQATVGSNSAITLTSWIIA